VGKGIRSPARDAVIADATPREIRGRAFGFHRAMDLAGAVVGPLVAWLLIGPARMQPAAVIRWSILPGLLAVVLAWFAMKQARTSRRSPEKTHPVSSSSILTGPDARRASIAFYLVVLFWLIRFPETLLLLRLQDIGLPVSAIPLIWAALHVVRTSASYSGGKLADRLGPVRPMVWGWLVYAAVCVGLATTGTRTVAVLRFLAFGLVAAL